ncbi:MAG: hypothetical protein V1799_00275 [bacterium]
MKNTLLFLIAIMICAFPLFAQDNHAAEVTAKVPELGKFHATIYKIWHTAWPKKDVEMLKSLLPEIEKGYQSLQTAKLPGILRDKKGAWDAKLAEIGETVKAYKASMEANDSEKLLKEAEKLHMQYEGMAKTINPILKEMDEFHQSLYTLYHYNMPQYDLEKIKGSVTELVAKMQPLNAAALPERLKSKTEKFTQARTELGESVKALAKVIDGKDKKAITTAIEKMHSNYQKLEKVFE